MRKRPNIEGVVIEKRYRVDKFIGGGSFGALFSGTILESNQVVAIKVESKYAVAPQIAIEFRLYHLLGRHPRIPLVYYFAPCGLYNAIVMEMLGPTLDNMHVLCKKRFSVSTTVRIGQQIISIIEFIHNKHIIFRDTKPENFLLGPKGSPKADIIHIIDFGLAKEYVNRETGEHIPKKTGKSLIGTPRYMSSWAHSHIEQSRRDDMLSIGYLLIYLMKGSLPWMGLKCKGAEKYKKIGRLKKATTPQMLCSDVPIPFLSYMEDVSRLKFESQPNYKQLSDYFNPLIDNNMTYDWVDSPQKSTTSGSSNETIGQKTISRVVTKKIELK